MADITITAANVAYVSGVTEHRVAGETLTAGQPVYIDASNAYKCYLARAIEATKDDVWGITLSGAVANQHVVLQRTGVVTIGATLTAGKPYVLSSTYGRIAPFSDLEATEYLSIIGIAVSAANLGLSLMTTGAQVAS